MLSFQIAIHARSPEVADGLEVSLGGDSVRTLNAPPAALTAQLPVTFEQTGEALSKLERLYFEPDGSFVWVSGKEEPKWQVDGNLFDRDGRLLFVDLKGSCPNDRFDLL